MTREEHDFLIRADLMALTGGPWRRRYVLTRPGAHLQRLRRQAEYRMSGAGWERTWGKLLQLRATRLGLRLGCEVPLGVAGAGLSIAHTPGVIVNPHARLGENCRLHQNVTIGGSGGTAPRIGDNVVIGAGAVILGAVTIGDDAVVGANSVVVDDVPPGVTVAGAPARVVSRTGSSALVHDGVGAAVAVLGADPRTPRPPPPHRGRK